MTQFMSCLKIQRTERPMIAKVKKQIPPHNETFLTKRLNMLWVGCLTRPEVL